MADSNKPVRQNVLREVLSLGVSIPMNPALNLGLMSVQERESDSLYIL